MAVQHFRSQRFGALTEGPPRRGRSQWVTAPEHMRERVGDQPKHPRMALPIGQTSARRARLARVQ